MIKTPTPVRAVDDAVRFGATPVEWKHFARLCGPDLLPIVARLDAPISKTSGLTHIDGKTPSRYNASHEVVGFHDWAKHQATARDIARWSAEPDYSIGLIGRHIGAIDIDIEDAAVVAAVREFIAMGCGDLPCRSRAGTERVLLIFRTTEAVMKSVIKTADGAIEVLGNNQQFVVAGTHKSGARYEWREGLPANIPMLSKAEIEALIEALGRAFGVPGGVSAGKAPIALQRARNAADVNDPFVDKLFDMGWVLQADADGKLHGACPNQAQHTTDSGVSATTYFPAGMGGERNPGFKCQHAHCSHIHGALFLQLMGLDDPAEGFEIVPADPDAPELLPAFTRNKKGKIEATRENLSLALTRSDLCRWQLRHDTFKGATMIAPHGTDGWRQIGDADITELCLNLEHGDTGFVHIPTQLMSEMLHNLAVKSTSDSAQQWLNGLAWDGVPRVDRFLTTYLNAEHSAYTRAVSRFMFSAMAARVLKPGSKVDMVPAFTGPQGGGKSSVVAALAPSADEFLEHDIGRQDDDAARLMRGKLIVELGELRGLRKRDKEGLKSFISRRADQWVPKFKEHATSYLRRSIFIGTTNSSEFLDDDTGHRRWLPVEVPGHADVGALKAAVAAIERDRDQLWAEGAMLFAEGGVLWEEAERLAKREHSKFEAVEPWAERIAGWLAENFDGTPNGDHPFTIEAVLVSVVRVELKAITSAHRGRVAEVLRKMGYANTRRMLNGVRAVYWEREFA